MTDEDRAIVVIEDLVVGDYYGLWEVLYQLEAEFPGMTLSAVRRLAQQAVLRLVMEDRLNLFRGLAFRGEELLVERDAAGSTLNEESWEPGPGETHIRVLPSESRMRELRGDR